MNPLRATHHVAIFIFDDVEVLDFAGPYEVFTTAARLHARHAAGAPPLFQVSTVARSTAAVRARAGLQTIPDRTFADAPPSEVLIVPGGVVTAELSRPAVLQWIATHSTRATITASVCTGAFLLAKASLLRGKRVTTHWEDIDELRATFPDLRVESGCRWIDEGRVVTSAGISAGIDMSLHLVERLAGRALAERTARQMEFDWTGNR